MPEEINQAYTITDTAYVAGFFDGEGCVRINKSRSQGNTHNPETPHYTMSVQLVNTDLHVLEYVQSMFGGKLVMRNPDKYTREGHKTKYNLNWYATSARTVLQQLLPYLRVKRKQAELAIYFQDSIITTSTRQTSQLDLELREILYQTSMSLKHQTSTAQEICQGGE